jgi:hypothetical protein
MELKNRYANIKDVRLHITQSGQEAVSLFSLYISFPNF